SFGGVIGLVISDCGFSVIGCIRVSEVVSLNVSGVGEVERFVEELTFLGFFFFFVVLLPFFFVDSSVGVIILSGTTSVMVPSRLMLESVTLGD
ncbi:hypothetical protein A2U01_0053435, partial [Trifolium medium]|nr:hypothetical protein [Trifolium medium]